MSDDTNPATTVEASIIAAAKAGWDRAEADYWTHAVDRRPFDPTITELDSDDADRGHEYVQIVTEVANDLRAAGWLSPSEVEDRVKAAGLREFADFDSLHDHLLDLNERGIEPDVSGYDRLGRPIIAWLISPGGDDTWPLGLTLGGEEAERPEPQPSNMSELAYPVRIAARAEGGE